MRIKQLLFLVISVGFGHGMNAQLNPYKYIIVPKKFDGFKHVNKYQTSTVTKHLFDKNGFTVVYDDALPDDLANNRCLGLLAYLEDNSSLFSTKTVVVLKDCQSKEVFRTMEGKSKIKEYKTAYKDAITKAFASFRGMDYKYSLEKEVIAVEEKEEKPITVSFKGDVKSMDKKPAEKVIVQEATTKNQTFKSVVPVPSSIQKSESVVGTSMASNLLYAQPIENGYQLVDSTPKVRLRLIASSMENVFLVEAGGKNGLVFKKGDKWFFEYVQGGKKILEELKIKF